jgi:uncharacterized membrane protein
MEKYQPGVCNIGKNERRKRYGIAVVGFAVTLLVVYLILSFDLPRLVLLLSFIPLAMAFEGFYQGYFRFCAGFAAAGISDLSGSGGSRSKVTNQEFHRKDMQKARQIHIYSIVSSIIIVALIYLFA